MRAKFGRGPTVVSKKGSLKFISRNGSRPVCIIYPCLAQPPTMTNLTGCNNHPHDENSFIGLNLPVAYSVMKAGEWVLR